MKDAYTCSVKAGEKSCLAVICEAAGQQKSRVDMHAAAGVAFAGVHDSFWTHAGDVPVLARQLRRTFLQLHSQPLLQQLLGELQTRHPNLAHKFPKLPETGELDLNEILDAEYFFS